MGQIRPSTVMRHGPTRRPASAPLGYRAAPPRCRSAESLEGKCSKSDPKQKREREEEEKKREGVWPLEEDGMRYSRGRGAHHVAGSPMTSPTCR